MMKTVSAWSVLVLSLTALTGCWGSLPREQALPNQAIGHKMARDTVVFVWVRRPDGKLVTERALIPAGSYIFPASAIDSPKDPTP